MKSFQKVMRRYGWLVLLGVLIGAGLSVLLAGQRQVEWATARVNLVPPPLNRSPQGEAPSTTLDPEAEIAILKSYPVLEQVAFQVGKLAASRLQFSDEEGHYRRPIAELSQWQPQPPSEEVLQLRSRISLHPDPSGTRLEIQVRQDAGWDALEVANALADAYGHLKQEVLNAHLEALQARLERIDQQIQEVDARRKAFLERHPRFVPGAEDKQAASTRPSVDPKRREALRRQESQLSARRARLNRAKTQLAQKVDPLLVWLDIRTELAGKPPAALDQIRRLEAARVRLLQQYTPAHPLLQENARALNAARASLRSTLSQQITARLHQIDQQLARLRAERQKLEGVVSEAQKPENGGALTKEYEAIMSELNDASRQYGTLSGQIETVKATLEALPQRLDVRYATEWHAQTQWTFFPILYGGALGAVAGLGLALLLAWGIPRARQRERPSGGKVKIPSGPSEWPVLGHIPTLDLGQPPLEFQAVQQAEGESQDESQDLLIRLSPPAALLPGIEAFRQLRTQILFREPAAEHRLLVLTSAQPGSGVSTVASNLAVAIAQAGKRCLLIESDLRDPQLHDAFGLSRVPGLTDVLLESASLDEAIRDASDLLLGELDPKRVASVLGIGNLHFLFAGAPVANASEIFSMPAFTQLVSELKERYEYVLVDCGSVLDHAAASVLAAVADGVLLVYCPRKRGSKKALAEARRQLQPADVWGIVLNEVPRVFL